MKQGDKKSFLDGIEIYIAGAALLAILWGLAAKYGLQLPQTTVDWPILAILGIGALPLLWKMLKAALQGEFGSDLLAGIAIITAVVLHEYVAGTVILLMLAGGASLEEYAMRRASSVLAALAKRMPQIAHRNSAKGMEDIPLDQVKVGDFMVVLPHESCPVDGEVMEGQSRMDESYLTGEPYHVSKAPGSEVLSGAINGEAALTVRANRVPKDSRYAKIVQVMEQAELNRPKMRRIADRLGVWYTVIALAVAGLSWVLSQDPDRFLAVLVIATPCPLLLAIPVAIIGAISMAASKGIIIKDPSMLERVSTCRTMIFDKTGTLTMGEPALVEIVCAEGVDRSRALLLAASVEQYSKHPLAGAIRKAAEKENVVVASVSQAQEKPGSGLTGVVGTDQIQITGRGKLPGMELPPVKSGMESILLLNGKFAAAFQFRDAPRRESKPFISHLAPKHGVNRMILLSGDREGEVKYLAGEVGIDVALFGKSPEEKVAIVTEESRLAATLFLGDGINDAPAMQAATVGIALGQNSDVTAEAADAVIFESSLEKVDQLIHIGRRMKRIALESAIGGMSLSVIGMGLAGFGLLTPIFGAAAQEVIDVLALLNALRVALPAKDLQSDAM